MGKLGGGAVFGVLGFAIQVGQAQGMIHLPGWIVGLLFSVSLWLLAAVVLEKLRPQRGIMTLVLYLIVGGIAGVGTAWLMYWSIHVKPVAIVANAPPLVDKMPETAVLDTTRAKTNLDIPSSRKVAEIGVAAKRHESVNSGKQPELLQDVLVQERVVGSEAYFWCSDSTMIDVALSLRKQFERAGWVTNPITNIDVSEEARAKMWGTTVQGPNEKPVLRIARALEDAGYLDVRARIEQRVNAVVIIVARPLKPQP